MAVEFIQGNIKSDYYGINLDGTRYRITESLFVKCVNSRFYTNEYKDEGPYKCNCNLLTDIATGKPCFIKIRHKVNPRNGKPQDSFDYRTGKFKESEK